MTGFRTRGQPAAIRHVSAMIAAGLPHALLLVGPASVGKTTLALDIAAAQLCLAEDPAARPCRACRGCRLVEAGNHPDVHRLAPEGAGSLIGIDAVRGVVSDLALLAAEGGARLAIFEWAHRLTEDAQNSLLKMLEEPPSGVTLILCAEDEDRLLPTIHSRVNRVRLGTLAPRAIEELLEERGAADAPLAARLARLAGGRPGLALAYARAPEAVALRGEIVRSLLDLVSARRSLRLTRIRELLTRAAELGEALVPRSEEATAPKGARGKRSRVTTAVLVSPVAAEPDGGDDAEAAAGPGAGSGSATKASPAERRRAATVLLDAWRDLARDLALLDVGEPGALNQPDLLEELQAVRATVAAGSAGRFLERLDRAGQLLEFNANPELTLDVLALAWPRSLRAA